jgi:hypothetical protein
MNRRSCPCGVGRAHRQRPKIAPGGVSLQQNVHSKRVQSVIGRLSKFQGISSDFRNQNTSTRPPMDLLSEQWRSKAPINRGLRLCREIKGGGAVCVGGVGGKDVKTTEKRTDGFRTSDGSPPDQK